MTTKEIKQKIVLEGEKQYNAAIKEAQRNLRTLKSELKAETAELGKNATEQQKAEAKTKSLKAQIKEQEKIVKTLRDALKEAKEQYGDNSDEIAKWEIKLNDARATLGNMKSDLAATTVATKSVADALGTIGSAGDSIAGAIEDIFTGMIDRVTDAVGQVWELISQTAAKANNWTDLAAYWGTDAQTIQEYARAVKSTGNNFEDLNNAVTKLVLGGKGKKITELIGVSDVNYKNDWDYAMAVMNRLYEMRKKGEDLTPVYEQIFGAKKATSVMDLLNDWDEIQRLRTQFNGNETGYGMSDEELATMDDLWVKINTISEKWEALKENFAAGFGVAALDLMVNVEGTLDGIADYMNATDDAGREAALEKIRKNVEQFFTKLGEIIRESIHILHDVGMELSESDDPLTAAIGDILVKLSEALQWMVDNQDAVKKAFEAIFGIWLLAKLAAVAGSLGKILLSIEAIKTFKGLGAATGAAEAATSGSALGSSWAGAFWAAAKVAAPALAFFWTLFENALTPQGNDDLWDEEGNPTELAQAIGIHQTKAEAEAEWLGSEEGQNSRWGGKGDRIEEAGIVNRSQYNALQNLWDNYSGNVKTHATHEELLNKARKEFEGQEDLLDEFIAKIYELRNSGERPKELPLEWFGVYGDEVTEDVDLDERNPFTEEDRENAVQDWWDAWRNAAKGEDSWDEENSAFEWFKEVFGDDFGEVYDRIIAELDKLDEKKQLGLDDLPADWWTVTSSWGGASSGSADENGITSADLEGFLGVPSGVEKAAEKGVKKGISGLRVEIDGQTAGRILAPYVSEEIAKSID